MTLQQLVNKAIPIPSDACRLIRAKLEWQRTAMLARLEQSKDLHMVPEWVQEKYKLFQHDTKIGDKD